MPLLVVCSCGKQLSVPETLVGKNVRCPGCQGVFAATPKVAPPPLPPAAPSAARVRAAEAMTRDLPANGVQPSAPARTTPPMQPPPLSNRDAAATRSLPGDEITVPMPGPGSTTSTIPQRIGRFVVRRFLGEGAFGCVYEAYDSQLDRAVALKVAKPELMQSDQRVKRFLREAKSAANLRHPHIVPVFDSGSDGGNFYIASAFIPGRSLDKQLEELPPGQMQDFRKSVQIVRRLAEALGYAHQRKVVHRDVKPANAMLDEQGEPLLMDFGLAAREEGGEKLTQEGVKGMGTPAYMAPEQGAGEAVAASDQYSLGCTLYELLTGQTPFQGPPELQMFLHQSQEPVRPCKVNPKIPLDLDTICLKCLEKDPAKRYPDCQALADDLRRWLDGEPIMARRLAMTERLAKWARRSPAVAGLVATVVFVTLLGGSLILWKWFDAERQKTIAKEQKFRAEGLAEDFRGQKEIAEEKEQEAIKQKGEAIKQKEFAEQEADKAKKARNFLVSIFKYSDANTPAGAVTARQILDDAEKRIPNEFANQPELQADLLGAIAEVHRNIGVKTPVAMLLEVRGTVQVQSAAGQKRQASAQGLLYTDDRLSLAAGAHVELVSLSDLHKERLKPAREVTVRRRGCEPADAIAERIDDILMTFVRLPKGTFYMGWAGTKKGVKTEIKEDFEIAAHAVTQGQWQAVMGKNPSYFSRLGQESQKVKDISDEELKLFPVEGVSWNDAQEFIKKLNEQKRGSGWTYRLPTEAEWEYACRGGATSEEECSFHFYFAKPTNDLSSEQANFNGAYPFGNAPQGKFLARPTRVGSYPPNKLGLCDMHGNVLQWCSDKPSADSLARVLRGGGWNFHGVNCPSAYRNNIEPVNRSQLGGCRLAAVPEVGAK